MENTNPQKRPESGLHLLQKVSSTTSKKLCITCWYKRGFLSSQDNSLGKVLQISHVQIQIFTAHSPLAILGLLVWYDSKRWGCLIRTPPRSLRSSVAIHINWVHPDSVFQFNYTEIWHSLVDETGIFLDFGIISEILGNISIICYHC